MSEVGEVRASQLMFTYGVGSVIDLPSMSVMIMGLDDWHTELSQEITEERLLAALKRVQGDYIEKLYLPPQAPDSSNSSFLTAVPVAPFPRWLRCSACSTLAPLDEGVFKLREEPWRKEETRFIHGNCTVAKKKKPTALPVRFLMACREGHLTDFPWIDYVHGGTASCTSPNLELREYGIAGNPSDIIVKCKSCQKEKRVGQAFDEEHFAKFVHKCPGHMPHLRTFENKECTATPKPIALGASNAWFPSLLSVISIPSSTDKLSILVNDNWAQLQNITSLEVLRFYLTQDRATFLGYTENDIWKALQQKRLTNQPEDANAEDIKLPEWNTLNNPINAPATKDFKLTQVEAPKTFETYFEPTILVNRLREVKALFGFTRIESNNDFVDATYYQDARRTRLSRKALNWLPAAETRGEGIFLRLKESQVQAWEQKTAVKDLENKFKASHAKWRQMRKLTPHDAEFPGIRYVLIHSLSHAIMQQLVLESGYGSASLTERLYCRTTDSDGGPMAGILIYTSASDSDGTLGGLVSQGSSISLGRQLQQTLENMRICGSDPLCSENEPQLSGRNIHAASCHACLFSPETSCEKGNRYLDRSTLVETLSQTETAFF